MDTAYLEIQPALENDSIRPLITTKQAMSNIGDSFSATHAYLPMLYTLQMVPSEAYDAIRFLGSAHPTTMLE